MLGADDVGTKNMMMIEARRAERTRSFLRARIIYNNRNSTIECIVKNFSPFGAKIELDNAMSIPNAFDLETPQKGRTFRSRLAFRNETSIGVEFIEDEVETGDRAQSKVERLENEIRRLRTVIFKLTKRLEDLGQDVSFS